MSRQSLGVAFVCTVLCLIEFIAFRRCKAQSAKCWNLHSGLKHGRAVSIFGKDMKRPSQTMELQERYYTKFCLNQSSGTSCKGNSPCLRVCCKMCRPCALHPRQSLIAPNVCRAWRLWWRDIPWHLQRWLALQHTQAILQLLGMFCSGGTGDVHFSFWVAFRSGRFMHQSVALRPPEVRCLKEEMVHGCTWMDIMGSNSYLAIISYWYWCAQFKTSWRLS